MLIILAFLRSCFLVWCGRRAHRLGTPPNKWYGRVASRGVLGNALSQELWEVTVQIAVFRPHPMQTRLAYGRTNLTRWVGEPLGSKEGLNYMCMFTGSGFIAFKGLGQEMNPTLPAAFPTPSVQRTSVGTSPQVMEPPTSRRLGNDLCSLQPRLFLGISTSQRPSNSKLLGATKVPRAKGDRAALAGTLLGAFIRLIGPSDQPHLNPTESQAPCEQVTWPWAASYPDLPCETASSSRRGSPSDLVGPL